MAEKRIALERWAAHLIGLEVQPLEITEATTLMTLGLPSI
jgi:hypothetical protein